MSTEAPRVEDCGPTDVDGSKQSDSSTSGARPWVVVAASLVVLSVATGTSFYALSAYASALITEGRFDLFHLSNAATCLMLMSGLTGVPLAKVVARYDARPVMIAGAVVFGGSLALVGGVSELWQLYAVYLLAGLGMSAISNVPTMAVLLRWFPGRAVRPLAIANSGLSVGGAVVAPLVATWVASQGLSVVMPRLGALVALVVVVLTVSALAPPSRQAHVRQDKGHRSAARRERVIGSRTFLALCLSFGLLLLAQVSVITHLLTIAQERGIDGAEPALVVIAGTSIIGRVLGLPLLGRISSFTMAVVMASVQGVGVVILAVTDDLAGMVVAAVLVGVAVGNNVVLMPLCLNELYGEGDLTYLFSWANLATTLGVGGAPALLGLGSTLSGSYTWPLLVIAAGSLTAGLLLAHLWVSVRRRRSVA